MRVSEGVPRGRFVELYNPGMFQEHEEVLVFTRDEFNRTYTYMQDEIDHINQKQALIEIGDDWKLLGYWPKILERIQILDININSIFKKEPIQCHLDAYLYDTMGGSRKNVLPSEKKGSIKL
jgi:hypothetical protein